MTEFNNREQAFENKYAHDADLRFRIEARATKLLGLWAAQEMGMDETACTTYAGDLVAFNLKEPGLNDIIGKVTADMAAKGMDTNLIAAMLSKFLADAEEQAKAA